MQPIAPFRTLALVCIAALLIGAWEHRRQAVDVYRDQKRNYPEAMARLYPGRPQVDYLLGRRAETLASGEDFRQLLQDPTRLEEFLTLTREQLGAAVQHYERALAAGLKSEENLQYNYALSLIRMRAEPERIDRAIADWRRNFPNSDYRDLELRRQAIEEEYRRIEQFIQVRREQQELERRRKQFEAIYGPSRSPQRAPPP